MKVYPVVKKVTETIEVPVGDTGEITTERLVYELPVVSPPPVETSVSLVVVPDIHVHPDPVDEGAAGILMTAGSVSPTPLDDPLITADVFLEHTVLMDDLTEIEIGIVAETLSGVTDTDEWLEIQTADVSPDPTAESLITVDGAAVVVHPEPGTDVVLIVTAVTSEHPDPSSARDLEATIDAGVVSPSATGDWSNVQNFNDSDANLAALEASGGALSGDTASGVLTGSFPGFQANMPGFTIRSVMLSYVLGGDSSGLSASAEATVEYNLGDGWVVLNTHSGSWANTRRDFDITAEVDGDWSKIDALQIRIDGLVDVGVLASGNITAYAAWVQVTADDLETT